MRRYGTEDCNWFQKEIWGSQDVRQMPKSLRSVRRWAESDSTGAHSKRKAKWLGKEET